MKGPIQVEIRAFAFANTPTLQYSNTPVLQDSSQPLAAEPLNSDLALRTEVSTLNKKRNLLSFKMFGEQALKKLAIIR